MFLCSVEPQEENTQNRGKDIVSKTHRRDSMMAQSVAEPGYLNGVLDTHTEGESQFP